MFFRFIQTTPSVTRLKRIRNTKIESRNAKMSAKTTCTCVKYDKLIANKLSTHNYNIIAIHITE